MSKLPAALVQHVSRELLRRSRSIKYAPTLIREISTHPLPLSDFSTLGLSAPLSQWQVTPEAAVKDSLWRKLNPFTPKLQARTPEQLISDPHQPAASLVFAPLVLDGLANPLESLAFLPAWFSADGVLLFALLGAGGLPELVNAQPEWFELLRWPNIMDAGARLQELRFGLPVLDIETVTLRYTDFVALWLDVQTFISTLGKMSINEREGWQRRLRVLFNQGLREISLQILYGQVWQVSESENLSNTHVVSLENLLTQLHHRRTPISEEE